MLRIIKSVVMVSVIAVLAACSSSSSTSPQLQAITVQTASTIISLGAGTQLSATGSYADGSSANLTSSVTWSSSNTAVANISNSPGNHGVATSVAGGVTTITATLGGVSGSTTLHVVPVGGASQGTPLVLTGAVSTLVNSSAGLNLPVGVTTDGKNLYIADSFANKIRKVDIASGTVSTLAGSGSLGTVDQTGAAAWFYHPEGITTDGVHLYVTERQSNKIRKIVIASGAVTTLTLVTPLNLPAILNTPVGITTDGTNLYVSSSLNHTISRIVISSSVLTTLAGSSPGLINGSGASAKFNTPLGITTDGVNLYVNDFGNNLIRKIVIASGDVSTLAGGFLSPATGITTDGTNLYVADYGNTIRSVVLSNGVVALLAGPATGLSQPEGLTTDGKSLFIVDSLHNAILKMN